MVNVRYKTKFVVQKHTKGEDFHWDLMIEKDCMLKTWRIELHIDQLPGRQTAAEQIFDHDLKFLTYNGPVNKGLGSVTIEDNGICEINDWANDQISGKFLGNKLSTNFTLKKIINNNWELKCR